MTYNTQLKVFLENKLLECNNLIFKRKKKYKIIKRLYVTLMTLSILGNSCIVVLSSLTTPPLAALCISAGTAVVTAISIKFNLADAKSKISDNIIKLNIIKDKLDYVVSCNGNLSKEECEAIFSEFRKL